MEKAERDLQVLGVRRWRELVSDGILFDRPKPTLGCSTNGRIIIRIKKEGISCRELRERCLKKKKKAPTIVMHSRYVNVKVTPLHASAGIDVKRWYSSYTFQNLVPEGKRW
jgi:hypothetical protein